MANADVVPEGGGVTGIGPAGAVVDELAGRDCEHCLRMYR